MSTWTSELARPFLAAGLCLLVSACGGGTDVEAMRAVAVTRDAVRVAGPDGFCVDRRALVQEGDSAFVLMGNCAALAGSRRAPQPRVPAVLTASISEPESGAPLADSIPELGRFFRSDAGRALLSRSGEADRVTVLESFHTEDVFFLHARDTSDGAPPGVASDYWRAYLDIGPRIATLSVLGMADDPPADAESLDLLRDLVDLMRRANPAGLTLAPREGSASVVAVTRDG